MADDPVLPNQTFIQSRQPARNEWGQNAYQGASSDLPGKPPTHVAASSRVSPPAADPSVYSPQTRSVESLGKHPGVAVPTHPHMTPPAALITIGAPKRPSSKRI